MAWTEERVTRLRELWAEGQTASQIAKSLGSVSRNAVIGKVHRLGLSNRSSGPKPSEAGGEEPIELKKKETVKETASTKKAAEKPEQPAPVQARRPESFVPSRSPTALTLPEVNPVAELAAEAEKNARKLSLLELNERTCKWPIGDPSTSDFYFCGLACAPEKPYCTAHVALAYQPMSSRRDRERNRQRAATA